MFVTTCGYAGGYTSLSTQYIEQISIRLSSLFVIGSGYEVIETFLHN